MVEIVKEVKAQVNRGKVSKQLEFLEDKRLKGLPWHVGCTACVTLVTKDHVYCANAGDSRAMLCKTLDNGKQEIIELSHDHKPSNEEEKTRIHAAGSWVIFNRINGAIAISRAIGDWEYKDPSLYLKMAREKKKPVFNRLEA